jgi:hypothetical protein
VKGGVAARPFLAFGILAGLLWGCRASAPAVIAAPPTSTQDACRQIRDFFKEYHAISDAPEEMSAGCHMNISAGERIGGKLDRHLQAHGWTRDPAYSKGAAPSEAAYATPSTRCTILQLHASGSGGGSVSGGVGIGGGSQFSTGFGIGLGIGSDSATRVNYKIDCTPR